MRLMTDPLVLISGLALACIGYNSLWYARFRDSLEDTDFGYASYHGCKAGKEGNRRVLSEAGDFPSFKTILYYFFYWSYGLSRSPVRAPRILFCIVDTFGVIFFSLALYLLSRSPSQTIMGTLVFCVLSSAPQLGGLYLQSEFWALTFTSAALALILSNNPFSAFAGGMCLAVNPLSVKPVYLVESMVLISLAPADLKAPVGTGFVACACLILLLYGKDGFLGWIPFHLKDRGMLKYFLKFNRRGSGRRRIRNLIVFFPVFFTVFPPLIAPALSNPQALPTRLWALAVAEGLIVVVQFRFFRYHFVTLLPGWVLLFACAPFSVLHLPGFIPVAYTLSFLFFKSREGLDRRLNGVIVHYHTRNCAARPIAEWIRENTSPRDRILVVGSTFQIYVHSERLSMYSRLFFTPEVTYSNPQSIRLMEKTLAGAPPKAIVLDQNCLNWKMVEYLTGSRYRFAKGFRWNSEFFPIYMKAESVDRKAPENRELFIECLHVTEKRLLWNPMPRPGGIDPNPTAFCEST